MSKYENLLLLRDFNSEMSENGMKDFSENYDLKNLIKNPTFKSIENPTLIDVILTNKWRSFQNSTVIGTGLSDHHKLTINTAMRCFFQKQPQ